VGMLTPGLDELGLVVYGGSGIVAYPRYALPYGTNVNGGGGPDVNFATTATTGPIYDQLDLLAAGGGTGTTEALAMAYLELQKAHYRDLALNGVDNALNAIVLFTDGVPDALAVSPNDANNPVLTNNSNCAFTAAPPGNTQMRGYMVATGQPPWSHANNSTYGLFDLSAYDSARTLSYWLSNPGGSPLQGDMIQPVPLAAVNGCNGLNNTGRNYDRISYTVAKVPPFDIYGNATYGNFYNKSIGYDGTNVNYNLPAQAYNFALASWNATDNLGQTIRSQTAMLPVTVYTIGFTGNGGTDAELLRRLANTQTASSYDPTQQTGMYIQVDKPSDIAGAFATVASQVLRLSK